MDHLGSLKASFHKPSFHASHSLYMHWCVSRDGVLRCLLLICINLISGYFMQISGVWYRYDKMFLETQETGKIKLCQLKMWTDPVTAWLISHLTCLQKHLSLSWAESFPTSRGVGSLWNPITAAHEWRSSSRVQPVSVCMVAGRCSLFLANVLGKLGNVAWPYIKTCPCRVPFSSVGRADIPYAEALSSLQQPGVYRGPCLLSVLSVSSSFSCHFFPCCTHFLYSFLDYYSIFHRTIIMFGR